MKNRFQVQNYYTDVLNTGVFLTPANTGTTTIPVTTPPIIAIWKYFHVIFKPTSTANRLILRCWLDTGNIVKVNNREIPYSKAYVQNDQIAIFDVAELFNESYHHIDDFWYVDELYSGLDVIVRWGYALVNWVTTSVADTSLTMINNTTNYIYFDSGAGTLLSSMFLPLYPVLAEVVTVAGSITSVTDKRPFNVAMWDTTWPASSADNNIPLFDWITGKKLKDSGKQFSVDWTLWADSDANVPTEKAVKTYVDNQVANPALNVQKNNTLVGTRGTINFIQWTNITLTVLDDIINNRINLQIDSAWGGSVGVTIVSAILDSWAVSLPVDTSIPVDWYTILNGDTVYVKNSATAGEINNIYTAAVSGTSIVWTLDHTKAANEIVYAINGTIYGNTYYFWGNIYSTGTMTVNNLVVTTNLTIPWGGQVIVNWSWQEETFDSSIPWGDTCTLAFTPLDAASVFVFRRDSGSIYFQTLDYTYTGWVVTLLTPLTVGQEVLIKYMVWTAANVIPWGAAYYEEFVAWLWQTDFILADTPAWANYIWVSTESSLYGKQWATRDWTYDSVTNTVIFNYWMAAGDIVSIQYLWFITTSPGHVSDTVYWASWSWVTTIAPSKNAVYNKIESITTPISDTAYGPTWSWVTGVAPSKNAVYNKIESLDVGGSVQPWPGSGSLIVPVNGAAFSINAGFYSNTIKNMWQIIWTDYWLLPVKVSDTYYYVHLSNPLWIQYNWSTKQTIRTRSNQDCAFIKNGYLYDVLNNNYMSKILLTSDISIIWNRTSLYLYSSSSFVRWYNWNYIVTLSNWTGDVAEYDETWVLIRTTSIPWWSASDRIVVWVSNEFLYYDQSTDILYSMVYGNTAKTAISYRNGIDTWDSTLMFERCWLVYETWNNWYYGEELLVFTPVYKLA